MTYLVFCTTATLFLIAFSLTSFFLHLARWAQHKRCTRELAMFQEALDASIENKKTGLVKAALVVAVRR